MSPRAAWRLEALSFGDVYDYVPGKADWMAHGWPLEGSKADEPTAGSIARRDAPTCGLGDEIGRVRERAGAAAVCVVVNEHKIVAGILRAKELGSADDAKVYDVMRTGPSTFRPHVPIAEMAEYMTVHDLETAPITSADGSLIGVLFRDDAVRVAHEHEH
jgi:Mg/Co/Ni transporter MgtE